MSNQIVIGSLSAIAKQENKSLAETFINAEIIVIVDTSGSMGSEDSRGGKSRYEVACEELANLQTAHPGKIAVIAFSNEAMFCPNGIPYFFGEGTEMDTALNFCKVADVSGMQFILISDGEPDDPLETLRIAKTFKNKINVIYVGPEERPSGRKFLEKLSALTGGTFITADRAKELKSTIEKYYLIG